MKDRVFIIWSGANDTALSVKKLLETEHNYICTVGGNSENNSKFSSIGDTVIQQMRSCNQAIVIFQKKNNGDLSGNLFFELGYALATYGQKKVHCVKMLGEDIVLPSDFDNAFVEPIECENSVEEFSKGIVKHFINRQKMSINENKMFIINNRYMIHEKIMYHYSDAGSRCSDYELAQYLLYYMQAAQMFNDVPKIYNEILDFKRKNIFEFSTELEFAVNICLSFFEMVLNIKEYEDIHDVYIDENTFFAFKRAYERYLRGMVEDKFGIFDAWAKVFINEHLTFGYMLYANNISIDRPEREKIYTKCIKYAESTIESLARLEEVTPYKENHDNKGILALLRAYVYRNMYIAMDYIGEPEAVKWLKESLEQRESLKNSYGRGSIDTQIYNTFCMEYYLALINYIEVSNDENIDEFDIIMYKREIKEYLQSVKSYNNETAYLNKIQTWCNA